MASSPLSFPLILLLFSIAAQATHSISPPNPQCSPFERDSLLPYKSCYDWDPSADCCSWNNIQCDRSTGRVISVDLSGCDIRGTLSANGTVFKLRFLQKLDFSFNPFSPSTIPIEITQLKDLRFLNISSSNLIGSIPESISNLRNLEDLRLEHNKLTGKIPNSIGNLTRLKTLSLSINGLTGTIPPSIGNLTQLTELTLNKNKLSGTAPFSLFQLPNILKLDLSNNNIEGVLPPNVPADSKLEILWLASNNFTGKVPAWLFTRSLKSIILFANKFTGPIEDFQKPLTSSLFRINFTGNKIKGPIPAALFQLPNLSAVQLANNNLSGVIEWSSLAKLKSVTGLSLSSNRGLTLQNTNNAVFNLPRLQTVELDDCGLTRFPGFMRALEALYYLSISNNRMRGTMEIGEGWKSLLSLSVSKNMIEGWIPASIGKVKSLVYLDLSYNLFGGRIPQELMDLGNLGFLNVSYNKLEGPIPSGKSFSGDSYIGNKGLCGAPLPNPC